MADGSIIIDTKVDSTGAEKDINKLSGVLKKGSVAIGAGIAAATGAVATLTGLAIKQYATYEQMTGGIETLFKNSASQVMEYANSAYKTAGLSANEYMNTITGFSASLLQGLGGDTKKAADIGNQAVIDMSDNANKMGSNMQDIQNAYQGFAKQNYTMLDNLKLGYGGTKSEMERLLVDAEKLTGIHYDINNFSDIIGAIHAIQENLGITGTTAKEAASTIEGSFNMLKASWKNVLTSMAQDNDNVFEESVNNLIYSISAFGENILPRIETTLNGIGKLIDKLLPPIMEKVPGIISSVFPSLLSAGVNIIISLTNGIVTALPQLAETTSQIISTVVSKLGETLPQLMTGLVQAIGEFVNTLVSDIPMFIEAGGKLLQGLAEGLISSIGVLLECIPQILESLVGALTEGLPMLLEIGANVILTLVEGITSLMPNLGETISQIIVTIVTFFTENLPQILEKGVEIILNLIEGINQCLPQLLQQLPTIIQNILTTLVTEIPKIIPAGIQIIVTLLGGIIQALPQLIGYIPQIVQTILSLIIQNLPLIISAGIQILLSLITGLIDALPQLINYIPTIIQTIVQIIVSNLPMILSAGIQLIIALLNGIMQAVPQLIGYIPSIARSIWNAFWNVNWLGLGLNIIQGIGRGIIAGVGSLVQSAISACSSLVDSVKGALGIHSPSRVMRDMVGKYIPQGISVGIDKEMPNTIKGVKANINDLYNELRGVVDIETAKTTAEIATVNNITTVVSDSTVSNNDKPIGQEIHKHYHVGPRELFEVLAPYADEVMDEWRVGR